MKSVLLVDDATLMRNLLRRILVQKGYEICGEASNGEEAFLASKLSLEKINTLVEIYNKICE